MDSGFRRNLRVYNRRHFSVWKIAEEDPKLHLRQKITPIFIHRERVMGKAKNWSSFLSEESKARQPSPLKALANHLTLPGLISLGGGFVQQE
jgi:hypothetical protein